jgi:hypothetical protein
MAAWHFSLSDDNIYTFCGSNGHPCFLSKISLVISWSEAVSWCESQSNQAAGVTYRLPAVSNLDVKTNLASAIAYFDLFGQNVWIGAYRPNMSQWVWVNNTLFNNGKSHH